MQSFHRYYQPRGSKDKLISSDRNVSGAAAAISELVNAGESDDPNTLIDIKITNPLRKIYQLIQEIKKKQSTTFSLKFTIPLVALPIFLFAAFQLGRDKGMCEQYFTSKIGMVKSISIEIPTSEQKKRPLLDFFQNLFRINKPGSEYTIEKRNLLIGTGGEITTILNPKKVPLDSFENKSVLVTGTYSSCTDIITIVSEKNISVL